jgi:hypothetical protein
MVGSRVFATEGTVRTTFADEGDYVTGARFGDTGHLEGGTSILVIEGLTDKVFIIVC